MATALVVGLSIVLSGCSEDDAEPTLAPPLETATEAPQSYDPELEPARAVLPLVPAEATSLEVTDFDRVRLELGVGDLTGASPAGERAEFWQRADAEAPLLSDGVIRPEEQAFAAAYGFTQDDVSWEAHFRVGADEGWVVKLRDGLPLDAVERATTATSGPLAGAEVDTENLLLLNGAAPDAASSWASEEELAALVPEAPAQATHVATECVDTAVPGDTGGLADLEAFSVSYGGTLATARLGEARTDVFERARLEAGPAFTRAFTHPVADPGPRRIGFGLGDAALAAELALTGALPFAVCA